MNRGRKIGKRPPLGRPLPKRGPKPAGSQKRQRREPAKNANSAETRWKAPRQDGPPTHVENQHRCAEIRATRYLTGDVDRDEYKEMFPKYARDFMGGRTEASNKIPQWCFDKPYTVLSKTLNGLTQCRTGWRKRTRTQSGPFRLLCDVARIGPI